MGKFMAAALSRLFKENEHLVQLATVVGTLLEDADTASEQVMRVDGECTRSMRPVAFEWKASFHTFDDLKEFERTIAAIVSLVREQ